MGTLTPGARHFFGLLWIVSTTRLKPAWLWAFEVPKVAKWPPVSSAPRPLPTLPTRQQKVLLSNPTAMGP
jgi:hypothetical protein